MFENKYANIKLWILSLCDLKRRSILPRHLRTTSEWSALPLPRPLIAF